MLRDRPDMARFVSQGEPVYEWAVRQFAGEGTGYRIQWENKAPRIDAPASNQYATDFQKANIQIAAKYKDTTPDGERLWATAVYELFNIRSGKSYYSLWEEAVERKSTLDEWVKKNMRLEFEAVKNTRIFFENYWRPLMTKKKIETHSYYWRENGPSEFDEWLKSIDARPFLKYWKESFPDEEILKQKQYSK